jgi:hypothetical protein
VSLHVRTVLEQCYSQNASNHDVQVLLVSFADQAEIRSDFDIFCKKKGIEDAIRIELVPQDFYNPLAPIIQTIKILLKRIDKTIEDLANILDLEQFEK